MPKPTASLAKKSADTIKRVEVASPKAKAGKTLSPKSNFPPKGYRRLTANMKQEIWEELRFLSIKKRKPVGQLLEELVMQYGDKVKAYKHPAEND